MQKIKVSVHPISHKLEWKAWQKIVPALRATDYKCPHCAFYEWE